jgi:hypothetical protein
VERSGRGIFKVLYLHLLEIRYGFRAEDQTGNPTNTKQM